MRIGRFEEPVPQLSPAHLRQRDLLLVSLSVGIAASVVPFVPVAGILLVGSLALAVSWCRWEVATWALLAGLVTLSYGFNNIPAPVPSLPIAVPLVDVLLVVVLVASRSYWKTITGFPLGRRIMVSLVALTAIGFVRLVLDFPFYGAVAGRDALYILEAWGVLVGYAWGMKLGWQGVERRLGAMWVLALAWFALYPFRQELAESGPIVGVQRPTPLLQFTSAGFISAVTLFWFLQRPGRKSIFFATLSVLVILMAQGRGVYLAVAATVAFLLLRSIAGSSTRIPSMLSSRPVVGGVGVALSVSLLALALLPPIPGRVGIAVGPEAVVEQLLTLTGAEGAGAGSFRHRLQGWQALLDEVSGTPGAVLSGVGFGPDLFQSFTVDGGVLVRKPHNDFLEVWARTGVVGLIPWLLLLGSLVASGITAASKDGRSMWVAALQFTMLITAFSQPFFGFAYGGLTYHLVMGATLGYRRRQHHLRSALSHG